MSEITWFGHSAFKIAACGASVAIDPFFAPGSPFSFRDMGKIDLVLISHDHGDHVGEAVELCKATGAMLGCMVGTAAAMLKRGVPQAQIYNGIGYNIGGTLRHRDIDATMVQAFHSSDSGAPAGYIIRMPDGLVLYHAGDTGIFSSMALFGGLYAIKLALLPIGGVFTMDAMQAAAACKLIGCQAVIPMHWGTFPALAQSTDQFKMELGKAAPECECVKIAPGQTINFD